VIVMISLSAALCLRVDATEQLFPEPTATVVSAELA